MNLNEVDKILNFLCPKSLVPFEFNGFLLKGRKRKIFKIAFTLGYSKASIQAALDKGVDVLVVHNAPERIVPYDNFYFNNLKKLAGDFLSIYRLHLPLDFVTDGIIDQLCKIMKFEAFPIELEYGSKIIKGGVYSALLKDKMILSCVVERVKLLKPKTIRIVRGKNENIKKIAITSGDGCKPEFLLQIKPDVFICGLLNQESIRIANDLGITIIEATSYATENIPLKRFVGMKKIFFPGTEVNFIDVENDVFSLIKT